MNSLVAYVLDGHDLEIRPAPMEREWMDNTHQRYAYRCLPLNIANAHGWEILCASSFAAVWDGSAGKDGVLITPDGPSSASAVSHFAHGILTFHIPCVFRTDPGCNLFITGPINQPKDAIAPLTAVVETDWAPYSFTMNWLFTRPNTPIRFERGEPFCHIFPVGRAQLDHVEPKILPLSANAELEKQYQTWSADRLAFNADLQVSGSQAQVERWQKNYFRGVGPTGERAPAGEHQGKMRLNEFRARDDECNNPHQPMTYAPDGCPTSDQDQTPIKPRDTE